MISDLHIALIQSDLHWENIAANLDMFSQKLQAIPSETDIVLLPEMFTTGFSMHSEKLAEDMSGKAFTWMKKMAEKYKVALAGSFICKENGNFYNRLLWIEPDGKFYKYDKRHLFQMADENGHYTAGNERLILAYKGWKICPLVCYDLRFPIFSRNSLKNNNPVYDLLIYVANWPQARNIAWETLLRARAIENQCYVAGLNRVGTDGLGNEYTGNSAIIDAKGNDLSKAKSGKEEIIYAELDYSNLQDFRNKFPVLTDADNFHLD